MSVQNKGRAVDASAEGVRRARDASGRRPTDAMALARGRLAGASEGASVAGASTRGRRRRSRAMSSTWTSAASDAREAGVTDALTLATRCARASNFVYRGDDLPTWFADDGATTRARGATGATAFAVADDAARNERFVVIRGAAWNQPDTDRNKLSWQIAKVWPQRLRRETPVVCHQGVLEMTDEFWDDLKPWLRGDDGFTGTFYFTGHSLGGSMAIVCAARARLELGLEESRVGPIHTFGAPPVLAYDRLASGRSASDEATIGMNEIMRLLGFEQGAAMVRQYVLANDVIPRMWLAADPVFSAATKTDFIGGLLDWRREIFGEGMFTKNRFLYESIGELYWLESANNDQGKPTLSRFFGDDVLTKLQMELEDITQSPMTAMRTLGDHNSQAYVDALQFLTIRRVLNPSSPI